MNQKKSNLNVFAGIMFVLICINQLINVFNVIRYTMPMRVSFRILFARPVRMALVLPLIYLIVYFLITIALFIGKRNVFPLISFSAYAFLQLISIFSNFKNRNYHIGYERADFNLFAVLPDLISLLGCVVTVLIIAVCVIGALQKGGALVKKIWFIPAVCEVFSFVVQLVISVVVRASGEFWVLENIHPRTLPRSIFFMIIMTVALLLANCWAAFPYGFAKKQAAVNGFNGAQQAGSVEGNGFMNLAVHVLLLLFTFGIWLYIWIYKTTKYLNTTPGQPYRNPATKLLLCMFVPFYIIYWTYKSAQYADDKGRSKGIVSEISTMCLIMAIFIPIVAYILIQDKINKISTTTGYVQPMVQPVVQPVQPVVQPVTQPVDVSEELRKYKKMLDEGLISQEDFDSKKKQFLGL